MNIGARLKHERLKLERTKSWMAKKVGVTGQCWANWEDGTTTPSLRNAWRIHNAFDIPLRELGLRYEYDAA